MTNRVISFSLFGTGDKYNMGMVENARLAPVIYPGWTVRVYATPDITVRDRLIELGCEVVDVKPAPGGKLMTLRFLACMDSDIAIFRDADSRLNVREAAAVGAWLKSGKPFHAMYDHPHHQCHQVLGGMWWCVGGTLPKMEAWIHRWPRWRERMDDMDLLAKHAWPVMVNRVCQHSSVRNPWGGEPFPPHEPYDGFVGQQYEAGA